MENSEMDGMQTNNEAEKVEQPEETEAVVTEEPVSNQEEKQDEIKKLHKKYGIILGIIAVFVVAGMIILNFAFKNAVALQKSEYDTAKALYEKAYEEIITSQDEWKKELSDKQEALNKAYEELETIYAERQAEIDAEEARWSALSKEEQEAEEKCNQYNEMVAYLRANNREYAEIYVEYAKYLDKNIFEIGAQEALAYTELYERKTEIEKMYMDLEEN